MHPNVLLPLASSLLSFIFAGLVFDQYLHRRKMYQLVWTLGLLLYAVSAGTEFLGGAFGWNAALFRWWYLLGAVGVAAYLGAGTVYLLGRSPFAWFAILSLVLGSLPALGGYPMVAAVGLIAAAALAVIRWRRKAWLADAFFAVLVVATVAAAVVIFNAPVNTELLPKSANEIVSGAAFPAYVRIITPLFNIVGASSLSFGAAYSAWHFWRTRTMRHRLVSNVFIAVGAFIPAVTSGLSRFGLTSAFFAGELLGVLCIFVGFLVSVEVFSTYRVPLVGVTLSRRRPEDGD